MNGIDKYIRVLLELRDANDILRVAPVIMYLQINIDDRPFPQLELYRSCMI